MKRIVLSLVILSTVSISIWAKDNQTKNPNPNQQNKGKEIHNQETEYTYAEPKEAKQMKSISPSKVDRSRKADTIKKTRSEAAKDAV